MKIMTPKPEKTTVAKDGTVTKANLNPVTAAESVNVKTTPEVISATPVAYGSIDKSSFLESFTQEFKAVLDVPGVVEFSKADAEKALMAVRSVVNNAVKTAHVQLNEQGLSSVTIWMPTATPLKVTRKASRSNRNPAFLGQIETLKKELLAAGIENYEADPRYIAMNNEWIASETTTDNTGKSVIKIKELTVEADGTTFIDAASSRNNLSK